jgi:hypothetical protein
MEDPMDAEIMSALIVGIVFVSVLGFVKMLSDNKIRSKLIDKDMVNENIKHLYSTRFDANVPGALKWGLALIGIGAAFLIGLLVPVEVQGEVTVGSMFLLAGLGFLVYYGIAKRLNDRS